MKFETIHMCFACMEEWVQSLIDSLRGALQVAIIWYSFSILLLFFRFKETNGKLDTTKIQKRLRIIWNRLSILSESVPQGGTNRIDSYWYKFTEINVESERTHRKKTSRRILSNIINIANMRWMFGQVLKMNALMSIACPFISRDNSALK